MACATQKKTNIQTCTCNRSNTTLAQTDPEFKIKLEINEYSESIASNTKSPTGGIFSQNSLTIMITKLNFDLYLSETAKPVGGTTKVQKKKNNN
jgi:hypothetical protein